MKRKTILMIEDETDMLISNGEFLGRRGYLTLAAETLREARSLLKTHAPDLILLDINLPDGSGLDFIAEVRQTADLPVIFLTCRTDEADVVAGLNSGGCDYITKPYSFNVMAARVEAQLRKAGMREVISRGPLTLHVLSQ